jgi:hypothetical protein
VIELGSHNRKKPNNLLQQTAHANTVLALQRCAPREAAAELCRSAAEGLRVEWAKFRRLVDDTVARLKAADGDRERIEAAIRGYIERGDKCGMSPMILWDYFAISSPGIPERAGYCGAECELMTAVFGRLSKERFGG